VRKTSATILLAVYIVIQLVSLGWNFYVPILHAICSDWQGHPNNNTADKIIIHTNLSSFMQSRQDENELTWKGQFYDIVSKSISNDSVTIVAERDKLETDGMDIYDHICQKISRSSLPDHPKGIDLHKWIYKLYMPVEYSSLNAPAQAPAAVINKYLAPGYYCFYANGPHQPPDTAS
jgi:hypothetical protein